jgi:DNA-binding response OmpR family regulator
MEHSLLRCLAEAAGRVLSYQELVQCMYGHELANPEAQVLLKTHVRNVRRKINPDYLVNIRSTGYKLALPESGIE